MSDELRILVVDDDRRMARTLVDICLVKGFRAEAAHSGPEALVKVSQSEWDCVLTDIKMPEVNGVELCRAIKEVQPDIPVVLMTAYSADSLVREGLQEGAVAALAKPLDLALLLAFFSFLRQERSIVIVDDDPAFGKTLGDILQVRGFGVTALTDPLNLVGGLTDAGEVLLLDMKLEGSTGLEVLRQVRERFPHLPVIVVTGFRQEMACAIETALEISASACLYKPLEIEKLLGLLDQIRHRQLGRFLKSGIQ